MFSGKCLASENYVNQLKDVLQFCTAKQVAGFIAEVIQVQSTNLLSVPLLCVPAWHRKDCKQESCCKQGCNPCLFPRTTYILWDFLENKTWPWPVLLLTAAELKETKLVLRALEIALLEWRWWWHRRQPQPPMMVIILLMCLVFWLITSDLLIWDTWIMLR